MLAIKHFEPYLNLSLPTYLHTNHNPLRLQKLLLTKSNQRLIRWSLLVQGHDLSVRHAKSRDNVVADVLSRSILDQTEENGWPVKRLPEVSTFKDGEVMNPLYSDSFLARQDPAVMKILSLII